MFDEREPVLHENQVPGETKEEVTEVTEDVTEKSYEQKMLDAILGFEGGEGWVDVEYGDKVWNTMPQDDPLAILSLAPAAKAAKERIDTKFWENDELEPEEVPEELKESGAIAVSLRDVRNSIGKDREQWK